MTILYDVFFECGGVVRCRPEELRDGVRFSALSGVAKTVHGEDG